MSMQKAVLSTLQFFSVTIILLHRFQCHSDVLGRSQHTQYIRLHWTKLPSAVFSIQYYCGEHQDFSLLVSQRAQNLPLNTKGSLWSRTEGLMSVIQVALWHSCSVLISITSAPGWRICLTNCRCQYWNTSPWAILNWERKIGILKAQFFSS